MKQTCNPFLPLDVYIPDGEPHVFGDRVYFVGSHDRENGTSFCELGYEFYSAPINDLSTWTSKGINYEPQDDPLFMEGYDRLYAPDMVRGNDGKYYLYYCLSGTGHFTSTLRVAVCDTPDGRFKFYGEVRNPDGTPFKRKITFDPGVINDDGVIRLYYGWSLNLPDEHLDKLLTKESRDQVMSYVFGIPLEELAKEDDTVMNAYQIVLDNDMLTVKEGPKLIVPGQIDCRNGEFKDHGFFEASSIRKINNKYYFIYSSLAQHELCYAISDKPDRDFHYGGILVDNGDISFHNRKEINRAFATGNNHGSLAYINGEYYITYHRHTNKFSYSRQACVEKIKLDKDGHFKQVEITSMGWNNIPLIAEGKYSAINACQIYNGRMVHNGMKPYEGIMPHIACKDNERFISEIDNNTKVVFKYFDFTGKTQLFITYRGLGYGFCKVLIGDKLIGEIYLNKSESWLEKTITIPKQLRHSNHKSLTLKFRNSKTVDLLSIDFK